MDEMTTIEVPVQGMDCAECTRHVQHAIAGVAGVEEVQVFLASEKAVIRLDPKQATLLALRQAVQSAGYSIPAAFDTPANPQDEEKAAESKRQEMARSVLTLFGAVFGAVLFIVVIGEWLGLFETVTAFIPWWAGVGFVLLFGFPIFRNVIRAALKGQILSHTLMTLGVIAALAVGQWVTAAVVVFFMRVGDYAEHFTTERARKAVKNLAALAPQKARIERSEQEIDVAIEQVQAGDIAVIRPGEKIPVDGMVVSGQGTIDQAAITGEAMPVEAGPGSRVFAASILSLGSLRVRVETIGRDTTFGKVIQLVEEAEGNRADVQRIADRVSAYYLPVVAGLAALVFLVRRDPLATAAVLVVACSCSFALATPIAMLASIGAGARRGLVFKGGKYIETLAKADVLLVDKTGTLTLGRPQISRITCLNGMAEESLLQLAATAERYSEHPLGGAVRRLAEERQVAMGRPETFTALPGMGVEAVVDGHTVRVGSRKSMPEGVEWPTASDDGQNGATLLYILIDGKTSGLFEAADTLRPEVSEALADVRKFGIQKIELLTGDVEKPSAELAAKLNIDYRAGLLPEDKIRVVKEYQAAGHRVVMVGDGINDAPALAQADVGIAMGAAGSDIAIEAAHMALLRDDWRLVPEALRIARRTMWVVKMNIAFTTVYNLVGLSLAAFGILPPVLAAAAQSLPDLGILGNSARLLNPD